MRTLRALPVVAIVLGGAILAIFVFLFHAHPGSNKANAAQQTTSKLSGSWVLTAYQTAQGKPGIPLPNPAITLTFTPTELHGDTGCNAYGAIYQLAGQGIKLTNFSMTLVGCLSTVGTQENAYVTSLHAATRYILNPGELVLTSTGPWTELRFEPTDILNKQP